MFCVCIFGETFQWSLWKKNTNTKTKDNKYKKKGKKKQKKGKKNKKKNITFDESETKERTIDATFKKS